VFAGERTKAKQFLTQWNLYCGINHDNAIMETAYQKAMLFLTYIQGETVNEWVGAQSAWLAEQVEDNGVLPENAYLWRRTLGSFKTQYSDNMEQERARAELKKGLKMQQGNIDEYVAKFERLIREAGYDRDTPLTIELFTNGLPNGLYEAVYTMDDPQTYERWKSAVLDRQKQYIHIQARKRLDGYRPPNPRQQQQNTNQRRTQDPNAMDTSPGRTRARLAGSEDGMFANHPNPPPYKPRGGFLQRRAQENRDLKGVTCFQCQQKGHLSYDCPQRKKGQQSSARMASNSAEDGEAVHVARNQTAREEASEWLEGASKMTDDAKDLVLQDLFQKADFQDT
jgi:hypothetical protein